jgi:hypothetical protein
MDALLRIATGLQAKRGIVMINVKDSPYNAVGDGIADDTAAIQAALDDANTISPHDFVYLPVGRYKISSTLWLTGSPTANPAFQTITMRGADSSAHANSSLMRTVIDASAITDHPALVIQGCRDAHLADFLLLGGNAITLDDSKYISIDPDDYQYPGLRVSRYSPHCGICVDPSLGSTMPPDGGYSGFTYLNATGASSRITLSNVTISRFIVGLMITPTDGPYSWQADSIQLDYCNINNCDIAVSVGQSQARGLTMIGGSIGTCRICFSGMTHGKQQGSPPKVYGVLIGVSGSVFHLGSYYGSTLLMSGCYIESINNLGSWGFGTASSQSPGKMIGCDIKLGYPEQYDPPGVAPYILELGAPFEFDTCVFNLFMEDGVSGVLYNVVGGDVGEVKFRNCSFPGEAVADISKHPLVGANRNLRPPYATFDNCRFHMTAGSGNTGRFMDCWPRSWGATGVPARVSMQASMQKMYHKSRQFLYSPGLPDDVLLTFPANSYSVDTVAKTISFAISNGAATGIIQVGDIVGWLMSNPWYAERGFGNPNYILPALRVASVTPNSGVDQVACAMLFGPEYYDDTFAPSVVEIYIREWAMRPDIVCEAAGNNSNQITLTTGAGQHWRVGDWIKAADTSHIPQYARVVSISADTLTLNRNTIGGAFSDLPIHWGSWIMLG